MDVSLLDSVYGFAEAYASKRQKDIFGVEPAVSPEQLYVLRYISGLGDHYLRMKELAERLSMSKSSFTKLVGRLEEKGLLERYRLEGNDKNMIIQASEAGRKLCAEYDESIGKRISEGADKYISKLSEESRRELAGLMDFLAGEYREL